MLKNHLNNVPEGYNPKGLSRRGESIYYIGTVLFVAGLILLTVGFGSILFYQIHYESDPAVVLTTTLIMGLGLIFISVGINFMINQGRKSKYIFSVGTLCSMAAAVLFLLYYKTNWYYPTISYVLALYLSGFILLMGNAFGNVTVWLIHNASPSEGKKAAATKREYTDEEINRDIEEAVRKSIEKAGDELQFDFVDIGTLKAEGSPRMSESIVKVKDAMTETKRLRQAVNPSFKEDWGTMGIEKASAQLAGIVKENSEEKTGFFDSFKRYFSKP
jgi:hypothetical protein